MHRNEQIQRLDIAKVKCLERIVHYLNSTDARDNSNNSAYCGVVWDNILCWDKAPAGTLQKQPCPDYVHGFNTHGFAYKYCTPSGKWFEHPELTKPWTNFSACDAPVNLQPAVEHADRLKLIQTIGYGVSLCSLVIAVLIMCCSRLKSKSNTLHVNLFMAFILRASLSFVHKLLFVEGVGLEKDLKRLADGSIRFIHEGTHWECRLLHTMFMYTICVSQMWIFVEGLYLHMLIYKTLSTERNGVKPYIILGWALPFGVIIPWIIVKAVADNEVCWNISSTPEYIWIIQGPMLATVLLNFFFFLNISRVLCSRVRSSQRHMGRSKYRHLAKFILVLIPLFGVFYIALAIAFPLGYANRFDLVPMYVEQTYNAFQGFLLALLFCFLNEEVHSEIKRIWWRRRTRRRDSVATRSYVLSSFKRNSYHNRNSVGGNHQMRSSARLPGGKQEPWSTRLKRRVLRWLGRDQNKDGCLPRDTTPPFIVRDRCCVEIQRHGNDEVELRMKLRDKNDNNDDVEVDDEVISSG